ITYQVDEGYGKFYYLKPAGENNPAASQTRRGIYLMQNFRENIITANINGAEIIETVIDLGFGTLAESSAPTPQESVIRGVSSQTAPPPADQPAEENEFSESSAEIPRESVVRDQPVEEVEENAAPANQSPL